MNINNTVHYLKCIHNIYKIAYNVNLLLHEQKNWPVTILSQCVTMYYNKKPFIVSTMWAESAELC